MDFCGRGTTCCSACARFFCEDEAVVELSFHFRIADGWMTEETRALVGVPLPIMRAGLAHPSFSSMRITAANVDAG